jgi:hypothetical protein
VRDAFGAPGRRHDRLRVERSWLPRRPRSCPQTRPQGRTQTADDRQQDQVSQETTCQRRAASRCGQQSRRLRPNALSMDSGIYPALTYDIVRFLTGPLGTLSLALRFPDVIWSSPFRHGTSESAFCLSKKCELSGRTKCGHQTKSPKSYAKAPLQKSIAFRTPSVIAFCNSECAAFGSMSNQCRNDGLCNMVLA